MNRMSSMRLTRKNFFQSPSVLSALLSIAVIFITVSVAGQEMPALPLEKLQLDHVVIATVSPDSLAKTFNKLKFVTKAGRRHSNGIENVFVEFGDNTEIELIGVRQAGDSLAAFYKQMIRRAPLGSGVFVCLTTSDEYGWKALCDWLQAFFPKHNAQESSYAWLLSFPHGHPLNQIFFIRYKSAYPSQEKYYRHQNGVTGMLSAWICINDHWENLPGLAVNDIPYDSISVKGDSPLFYRELPLANQQTLRLFTECPSEMRIAGITLNAAARGDEKTQKNSPREDSQRGVSSLFNFIGGIIIETVIDAP